MHWRIKREALVVIGLFILVAMSWQFLQDNEQTAQHVFEEQKEIDGYLNHFVVTSMDEQGQPNHRLEAERMVSFTGSHLSQLDKPFMTLYRDNANPWLIRAQHGLVQSDKDVVYLTGGVRMTNEDALGNLTEVLTDTLEVQARVHYAETNDQVTLHHYQGQAQGTGMQAYLKEGRLALLDEVRSRYEAVKP